MRNNMWSKCGPDKYFGLKMWDGGKIAFVVKNVDQVNIFRLENMDSVNILTQNCGSVEKKCCKTVDRLIFRLEKVDRVK